MDHAPVHRTPGPAFVEGEVLLPDRIRPGGVEPPETSQELAARILGRPNGHEAIGLTFQALVFVTMRQEDRYTLLAFEQAVTQISTSSRLSACSAIPTTSCGS